MGEVQVPDDKYWGAQTQRSFQNFKIGGQRMPDEIVHAFAVLKKAAALTNADLTDFPREKADAIASACDEVLAGKLNDHFPLVVWQTGSGTQSNMNMNEVVANRATEIMGGDFRKEKIIKANDDVNKSQSSNDTFPTAMHIASYGKIVEETLPKIQALRDTLHERSVKFSKVIKSGRTHLMDATPLTLGQEFGGYVTQLDRGMAAIKDSLERLRELALGGTAVGTGLNTPPGYSVAVAEQIASLTGHPFITAENKFESLSAHDAMVEISGSLKRVAVSLFHIANNIRMLASGPRTSIGEISLPANEPGSSIMPGKVNPVIPEAMNQTAYQVIASDLAVTLAAEAGQLQLNAMEPMIIYNLLNSLKMLKEACEMLEHRCIRGIIANEQACAAHVDNSIGIITALVPHIGYSNASRIAHTALMTGSTVKALIIEENLMSESELNRLLSPQSMLAPQKSAS